MDIDDRTRKEHLMNEIGNRQPQLMQVMPIVTSLVTDGCAVEVAEERDPLTGQSYKELIVSHLTGHQYRMRFYDKERARQVGRALIKQTAHEDRTDVKAPTPLRDSMRALAAEGDGDEDSD